MEQIKKAGALKAALLSLVFVCATALCIALPAQAWATGEESAASEVAGEQVTSTGLEDGIIDSKEELLAFANQVNNGKKYADDVIKLGANIDLTGVEWAPIGGDKVYFAGEFDGQGYTISNLTQTTGARMGLFGLVEKAYIHDFTLKNVSFTVSENNARVGAVAGNLQYWNVLENITVDGIQVTLNGKDGLVGAVTGYAWKSQLSNVNVKNAKFDVNGTGNVIGGNTGYGRAHVWDKDITGNNDHWLKGTVQNIGGTEYVLQNYFENCKVTTIEINLNNTGNEAGGFFGSDTYNSHSNYFVDCHVSGLDVEAAEGTSQTVGGFIAWNNGTTAVGTVKGFDKCSVSGTIEGANGSYGGFAGQVGGRACSYENASADVDITSTGNSGGFVGITQAYSTHQYTFTNCSSSGDVQGRVAGGFVGKNALSGDGKSVFVELNNCSASGSVQGTFAAGGLVGEVNTELPANNWNIVDGTGSLELIENSASTQVSGPKDKTGNLIGYLDVVANGDAKEGNKVVVLLVDNKPEAGINSSEDTLDEYIVQADYVAQIGDKKYLSIEAAVNEAVNDDVISLLSDDENAAHIVITDKAIAINLNGKKLKNVSFLVEESAELSVQNGSIESTNPDYSAIETLGKLTVENVDITSARHALRVDDAGVVVVNGGTYAVAGTAGKTTHALNASANAKVTIKNGTFIGPKSLGSDSGAAINSYGSAVVTIEKGTFKGGLNNTIAGDNAANVVIEGGWYDQNPSAYVASDLSVIELNEGWLVGVANPTMTFVANGGSEVASQTVELGQAFAEPAEPTRDGYTFAGWYADAELTQVYDFGTEAESKDITLYAKWTEIAAPEEPGTGDSDEPQNPSEGGAADSNSGAVGGSESETDSDSKESEKTSTPKTGDATPFAALGFGALALIAAGALVATRKVL